MNLPQRFPGKFIAKLLAFLEAKKSFLYPLLSIFLLAGMLFLGAGLVNSNNSTPAPNLKLIFGFREILPTPAPYPVNQNILPLPELTGTSIYAVDVDSMVTLYEKNSETKVFPASTTKIMTVLVALDTYSLDQILEASFSGTEVDGNLINLFQGEKMSVENLLYATLVASGNDAAYVLAANYPTGYGGFIEAMNQKAAKYFLNNTHFVNSIGLDEEGHFSTAKDLARLAIIAMKNPTFAKIVATPSMVITDETGKTNHYLTSTNELIGKVEGVRGVKTGWTENAGECLITFTERNNRKIVIVILGSKDRFGETQKLIEWVFQNFSWGTIVPPSFPQ